MRRTHKRATILRGQALARSCVTSLLLLALSACGADDDAVDTDPVDAGQDADDGIDDADVATPDVADPNSGCITWIRTSTESGGVVAEMFAYEASRPDATESSAGTSEGVCSRPGVIPRTSLTWDEANAACTNIRARLCTGAEWDNGCYGPGRASYPYGDTYDPLACNTLEAADGCLTGACRLAPTGSYDTCISASGIADMTGNASEWVGDQRTFGDEVFDIRGGHYASADDATTRCRNAHFWHERTYADPMLGFRCCRDIQ